MGFKLGAFIGGVAKGASESIEELEKLNTTSINNNVKSMYHNYQEYKKEVEKKKESLRGTVGTLRGLKFTDGPLDDEQLIALASNPKLAEQIADTLTKNPDRLVGLSKSFITAANVPKGQKFDDFLNDYGKKAALTSEEFAMAASNKEEGFLNKMIYGDNLKKITAASRQLGVKPEELYAYGASKGMPSYSAAVEVDYSKLKEKPDFKKIEDAAKLTAYEADRNGTDQDRLNAAKNLATIKLINSTPPKDLTQAQIENNYANEIIKLRREGNTEEAKKEELYLRQWQKLVANPITAAVKTDADKISQANLIVTASKTMEATFKSFLPGAGAFTTKENLDGTVSLQVASFVKPEQESLALAAGRSVLIKEMTKDGKPKSEMHKNALMSAGVQFDQDGNTVNPKIQYGSGSGTPAPAPAPGSPRLGAPRPAAPAPALAPAASVTPAVPPRFATPQSVVPLASYDPATGTWK